MTEKHNLTDHFFVRRNGKIRPYTLQALLSEGLAVIEDNDLIWDHELTDDDVVASMSVGRSYSTYPRLPIRTGDCVILRSPGDIMKSDLTPPKMEDLWVVSYIVDLACFALIPLLDDDEESVENARFFGEEGVELDNLYYISNLFEDSGNGE